MNDAENNSQQKLKGIKKIAVQGSPNRTLGASTSAQQLKKKTDKLDEIVEKEKLTGKHMNKAEIYQAVRKARLRSNYMNRDLGIQNIATDQ